MWTSTDVKTIRTKRPSDCIIKKIWEVPSKLEIQCKKGVHFHLTLLGIPSSMIVSVKDCGWGQRAGEFYFNWQNLL